MDNIDKHHDEVNKRYWVQYLDTIKDSRRMKLSWDIDKITGVKNVDVSIICNQTFQFKMDYKGSSYQDVIDRMINEVSNTYRLLYVNSKGNYNDHTNYLAKFSDSYRLVYEKRISSDYEANRSTYRIGKPVPKTINNKTVAMVYVDLLGCSYHKINFKGGGSMTFSDVTEDDFWKNRSLIELNW